MNKEIHTETKQTQFQQQQFDALYPEGAERYYWNIARNKVVADVLENEGLQKERMLEIGCGKGIVLQELRSRGFDCYGVDLAQTPVSGGLEPYVSYGKDFANLEQSLIDSVTTVLLLDVIEHIEDDRAFLESIRKTFPNLSHLIISVPARMELWSNFDTFNGHFRRYTLSSLEEVLSTTGFRPIRTSYFFRTLYIPARIFSLLNLMRETIVRPPKSRIALWAHKILGACLYVEYKIVPRFILGTSIIGVARINQK